MLSDLRPRGSDARNFRDPVSFELHLECADRTKIFACETKYLHPVDFLKHVGNNEGLDVLK